MVGAARFSLALLCLLALVTSASAEGAWDSVGTFSTRELCMDALHQQAQAVEKLGLKVTEDVPAGSFLATGADQDVRGQCLRRPARAEREVSAVDFDYHALATLRGICSTCGIRESGVCRC